MVNNSTNINKKNNHLTPQLTKQTILEGCHTHKCIYTIAQDFDSSIYYETELFEQ